MGQRWIILAVLTLARTAMGFQFQSVPALTSHLTAGLGLSFAVLGTLIGLYLIPGAVIAFPGGWLGQRFGDKRIVVGGLRRWSPTGLVGTTGRIWFSSWFILDIKPGKYL